MQGATSNQTIRLSYHFIGMYQCFANWRRKQQLRCEDQGKVIRQGQSIPPVTLRPLILDLLHTGRVLLHFGGIQTEAGCSVIQGVHNRNSNNFDAVTLCPV